MYVSFFKIIRVQSPDGMKKIPSTKRETAAAFLKKVCVVLLVHVFRHIFQVSNPVCTQMCSTLLPRAL